MGRHCNALSSEVEKAATSPGHAANKAYIRKMRVAKEEWWRQGIEFTHLVMWWGR